MKSSDMAAHRSFICRMIMAAAALCGLAGVLPAQNVLLVKYGDKYRVVRKVVGVQAFVEDNGKLKPARGTQITLQPVDEFLPVFVAVRGMTVKSTYRNLIGAGTDINHEFHFDATFESPYALDDVFMVLELNTARMGKALFYYEVGRMESNVPRLISTIVTLSNGIGAGHFKLHLFAHGAEVFQSEQPEEFREHKLDQMVEKRIAKLQDAAPRPLVGPPPEYPADLRQKKIKGTAVVEVRLSRRGTPLDPMLVSATDPAFGVAAMDAIRQWRFLPAVQGGQAVETKVDMPFSFSP